MRHWIKLPRREGEASRQAHADLPAGTYERELGRQGFFGPASQMYHRHAPTGWTEWAGDLRPRAFDTAKLPAASPSGPAEAPMLLGNAHLALRFWRLATPMDHLLRNGDGDELLFIHQGAGDLFCDYGHLTYAAGDYILLPRGTMWRLAPIAPSEGLMIEATNGGYGLPDKGLLGQQALFDPGMFDVPALDEAFLAQQGETPWAVKIKRRCSSDSGDSRSFNHADSQ